MTAMKLTSRHRERFVKREREVRGLAVGFRIDRIRLPDGTSAGREYLTHPGAVGVLAFPKPGRVLLVKQYRYPVGEFTLEIPAGKLAKGEDPADCVKRELEEEAGYRARRVKRLVQFWPTPAFSDEVLHLFVATDLVKTKANPDDDEYLEVVDVSVRNLERLIRRGRIRDSKTLIAYLTWKIR